MSRHRSDSMWSAAIAVIVGFGMLGLGVIGALPASSATSDIFQPDALIKLRSDKDYLGDNIYNLDATDQTRIEGAKRGQSKTFYIQVQNDGNATDSFNIHGSGGGYTGGSPITIAYFAGTTDITVAVEAGAYNTGSVAPGGSATIIDMVITVNGSAQSGITLGSLVTATSTHHSTAQDAVAGAVKLAST